MVFPRKQLLALSCQRILGRSRNPLRGTTQVHVVLAPRLSHILGDDLAQEATQMSIEPRELQGPICTEFRLDGGKNGEVRS